MSRLPNHSHLAGSSTERPVGQEILHSWAIWESFKHLLNLTSGRTSENLYPLTPMLGDEPILCFFT